MQYSFLCNIRKRKPPNFQQIFRMISRPCKERYLVTRDMQFANQNHENGWCSEMNLPVLGNVETPLEPEMLLLIVIHEARDGVVVATGEHAGGSLLLLDLKVVSD